MSRLGRQDGESLVADLSDRTIKSWPELWDALMAPCGLPDWFGRNLNAWRDTIDTGGISSEIDRHSKLIVRVAATGMFAPSDPAGAAFAEVTNASDYAAVEVVGTGT